MLFKKIKYGQIDLSDAQFTSSGIVVQNFEFPLELDTQIETISLGHGQKAFSTRANGRIYAISGYIIGRTASERNKSLEILQRAIRPVGILGMQGDSRLEWQDFNGKSYWTMARVYEAVKITHEIRSDLVEFSFSLFAENPAYYSSEKKTIVLDPSATVGYGLFTGDADGVHLGYMPAGGHSLTGTLAVNEGNFEAGVIIEDYSGIDGNYYENLSNGLKYGVSGIAEHRRIDTMKRPTEILDYGRPSQNFRLPRSMGFLLSP